MAFFPSGLTTPRLRPFLLLSSVAVGALLLSALVADFFDFIATPGAPLASWTALAAVLVPGAPSWAWGFVGGLLAGAGLTWGLTAAAAPSPTPAAWVDVPLIESADLFERSDEETFPVRKDALPPSVDADDVIAVDDGTTVRCLATVHVVRFYKAKPSSWAA